LATSVAPSTSAISTLLSEWRTLRTLNDRRGTVKRAPLTSKTRGEVVAGGGLTDPGAPGSDRHDSAVGARGRIRHDIVMAARDRRPIADRARRARRARRGASVCTGAFLLAEAGLLDGRRATTHWALCAGLQRRYPSVRVERDPIFVRDGNVFTSAGITAGMDL